MQDRNSTTNQTYRQTIHQATNQNNVYSEFTFVLIALVISLISKRNFIIELKALCCLLCFF